MIEKAKGSEDHKRQELLGLSKSVIFMICSLDSPSENMVAVSYHS